jgi:hypothetical protein
MLVQSQRLFAAASYHSAVYTCSFEAGGRLEAMETDTDDATAFICVGGLIVSLFSLSSSASAILSAAVNSPLFLDFLDFACMSMGACVGKLKDITLERVSPISDADAEWRYCVVFAFV